MPDQMLGRWSAGRGKWPIFSLSVRSGTLRVAVIRRDKDGFVFFFGRADDLFQCGGENVYPGVAEKLLGRHPDVAQDGVVPVANDIRYQLPVTFVVPRPAAKPTEDALCGHALDDGPAYAHPRAVWLVDDPPPAGTHKINRPTLAERAPSPSWRQ